MLKYFYIIYIHPSIKKNTNLYQNFTLNNHHCIFFFSNLHKKYNFKKNIKITFNLV